MLIVASRLRCSAFCSRILCFHPYSSVSRFLLSVRLPPPVAVAGIGGLLPDIRDSALSARNDGKCGTLPSRILLGVVHREAAGGVRSPGNKTRLRVPPESVNGTRSCTRSFTCEVVPQSCYLFALWHYVEVRTLGIDGHT